MEKVQTPKTESESKGLRFEFKLDSFDEQKKEENLWMARTGLDRETLCGAVETVIFMSDRPISLEKIRNLIDDGLPVDTLRSVVHNLQQTYNSSQTHGIQLMEVSGGYQFRTKSSYAQYAHNLSKAASLVLSPSALEVLAIVAYKGPVAKTEINRIRGVDSGHIIRGLMDKRLVKTSGRSDDLGRPVLYSTTSEFLEVFNLSNLQDLPSEHELKSMLESGKRDISDIKTLVKDRSGEDFSLSEIQELDQLAASIKSISTETDFTTSLKSEEQRKRKGEKETFSAFELLEQYIARQTVAQNNKKALESEQLYQPVNPGIIGNFLTGPFNLPEKENQGSDFQMIDLETGKPLEEQSDICENDREQSKLEDKIEKLETKTDRAAKKAKELDLDLDFMKSSRPESSP